MATKNVFANMLNQKMAQAPQLTAPGVKVQKAPGTAQFAYLGQGNSVYRHPMSFSGPDVSRSVWAKALNYVKPKGVKNG